MKLQIALNDAKGRSESVTAERLINMFAEKAPDGAESTSVTHGVPGMTTFATQGTGPCRALITVAGAQYQVSGTGLYLVGVDVSLGTVPGDGLVSIASDGDIIVIVTDPDAYTWTISTATFAQVTDANYAGAHSVIWMNQYFIFANRDFHFLGAVGGLLPFDALMAASAEYAPDAIIGLARDHNELLIFGETTLEAWQNVTTTDPTAYSFDAITGATAEKGLASRFALTQLDNTTVWLDQNGIVRRLADGYVPQRISTDAVEHQIALSDFASATMLVYIVEGHECFALTTNLGTWVYDANTTLWHERKSYGLEFWKAQCSAYANNRWYVGNYADGVVSSLDLDVNDENGTELIASMIYPPVVMERSRFTLHELELGADMGVGTLTANPIVTLRLSRNGSTWSNGSERPLGLTGERDIRAVWRVLGQWDKVIIRLDISSGYKRCAYAAYASLTRNDR